MPSQDDQDGFDAMYNAMLNQGHKCANKTTKNGHAPGEYNLYYGEGCNDRCAVGFLIPEEQYNPGIEGQKACIAQSNTPALQRFSLQLLQGMQDIHDKRPVNQWAVEMDKLAERLGLMVPNRDDNSCEQLQVKKS